MAKRSPRSPLASGLFSSVPAPPSAPAPLPVMPLVPVLSSYEQDRLRLDRATLEHTIAGLQAYLACPLASWEEWHTQVTDVHVSMSLLLGSLSAWLPADLQPLVRQFLQVRTSIVLRSVEGRSDG